MVSLWMAAPLNAQTWKDTLNPSLSLRQGWFEQDRAFTGTAPIVPSAAWVTLRPSLSVDTKAYVEGFVSHLGRKGDAQESELREAYLEQTWGAWDLRLGRQITVWGRADKLNPTDVLSSQNLLRLSPEDEDQRQGIGAIQAAYSLGVGRLIAVWQWEWRAPRFPLAPLPPGLSLVSLQPEHPERQFALKYDVSGGDWDGSVSLARVYDRTPDLSIAGVDPGNIQLALRHHFITMVGMDAATTLGAYGLRAEIAHLRSEDADGDQLWIKNPMTYGVLGIERTVLEQLTVNAQYFARAVDKDSAPIPAGLEGLAARQQLLSQQQRAWQDGCSLRLSQLAWQDTLASEVTLVWNRQLQDYFIKPQIRYQWNDHWQSTGGAWLYRGQSDTFFGQLRSRSSAFVELRYQI